MGEQTLLCLCIILLLYLLLTANVEQQEGSWVQKHGCGRAITRVQKYH